MRGGRRGSRRSRAAHAPYATAFAVRRRCPGLRPSCCWPACSRTSGPRRPVTPAGWRGRTATPRARCGRRCSSATSTSILAVPHVARLGIEADAHGCRQLAPPASRSSPPAGARAPCRPSPCLALGSNGAIGDGAIARALRVVGPGRVLGLVTPRRVGSGCGRRAAAEPQARHPDRVVLIDWLRFSRGHGGWFAGDGLHVGDAGARAFAGLIRHRLAPFFPPRSLCDGCRARARRERAPDGRVARAGRVLDVVVVRGGGRMVCARARRLVRAHPLATPGIAGWRCYGLGAQRPAPVDGGLRAARPPRHRRDGQAGRAANVSVTRIDDPSSGPGSRGGSA